MSSILLALRRDATQLLPANGAFIEWDTEDRDSHNLWHPAHPLEIRAPAAGVYNFQANVAGAAIVSGSLVRFVINAATPFYSNEGQGTGFSIGNTMVAGSMTVYLQKDDIVKVYAFSLLGGTIQARLGGLGRLD